MRMMTISLALPMKTTSIVRLSARYLLQGLDFLFAELPQSVWPNRGNQGQFPRQGRFQGGRRNFDNNLVADMKLTNNHGILCHKCPAFQEPCEIACFSRTADGHVFFDDRCLRRFRPDTLHQIGADLNAGFETFVEKREDLESCGFSGVLDCIRENRIPLDNIHFVTFRNNLNKILGTTYNRHEAWEMGVHKRRGTVYLDVHKLPEGPVDERQKRMMYWGYAFENLATEQNAHEEDLEFLQSEAVDANVEFCALIKTKLGAHRIIMGAEMDCFDGVRDGKRNYLELKTCRELDSSRAVEKFHKDKLLKYWIQSFLAGVSKIVCAYRNDDGVIVRTEIIRTREITQRVKDRNYWQGGACLAFGDQVLCWLYGTVKENEDYVLRFNPGSNRLELRKGDSCPQSIVDHIECINMN